MVITGKNREEKGGWFGRARLVACQYQWSVFTGDASASVIVRLLPRLTLDVKDVFLPMHQPKDEKAVAVTPHGKYKLNKNPPAQCFGGFCAAAQQYGLTTNKTCKADAQKPPSAPTDQKLTKLIQRLMSQWRVQKSQSIEAMLESSYSLLRNLPH